MDYTDQVLFPLDEKRWRSLTDRLGKEGLADTIHHEEIPADTIGALYELFVNTVESLNARGSSKYSSCLAKIPPAYHHKLHFLLQWCAQVSWLKLNDSPDNKLLVHFDHVRDSQRV